MTIAPVRLAIFAASAMWSKWPCDTRIKSALASADFSGAVGESSKKGSISRVCWGVVSCQLAWPSQVSSQDMGLKELKIGDRGPQVVAVARELRIPRSTLGTTGNQWWL